MSMCMMHVGVYICMHSSGHGCFYVRGLVCMFECLSVYAYVCAHVCVHVYECMHACWCTYLCASLCPCLFAYLCVCARVWELISDKYVHMFCVCLSVCMSVICLIVYAHLSIHNYSYVSVHVCTFARLPMTCMCICMCACLCVHMCACAHTVYVSTYRRRLAAYL